MPSSIAHTAIPSYWRYGLAVLASFLIVSPAAIILRRVEAAAKGAPGASRDSLREASALDPSNDIYWIRTAQLDQDEGRDPLPAWERALAANPRGDLALTQAAIAAELAGRPETAERLLLASARFNQLWLPRWSLANFYYRRGDRAGALRWAGLALQRSFGDRTALFRLCLEAGATQAGILRLMRPQDGESLGAYALFLAGRSDSEPPVLEEAVLAYLDAPRNPHIPPEAALTPALAAINALLGLGQPAPAVRLWDALAKRGLHAHPSFDAARPLTNPGFAPPVPGGLDWRISQAPGIEAYPGVQPGGIKLVLTGRQAESAVLLEQWVWLRGGRTWELRQECQTVGLTAANAGLDWALTEAGGTAPLAPARSEALASDEWAERATAWAVPPGDRLYRLSLRLRRPAGQTRAEGEARLRGLSLREARP